MLPDKTIYLTQFHLQIAYLLGSSVALSHGNIVRWSAARFFGQGEPIRKKTKSTFLLYNT